MCVLGCPGDCRRPSCWTHCYIPAVTPIALCCGDVSSTCGLCLPSSYQGNLWLLEYCPDDTEGDAPSCQPGTCTTRTAPWSCCEPYHPAAVGTVRGACDTAGWGPRPRHSPRTQATGRTSSLCAPRPHAPAALQARGNGRQSLGRLSGVPKSSRTLPRYRPGSSGYRSYQNFGFTPGGGFSPSCYVGRGYQPPNSWMRNCPSWRSRPMSCTPQSYFSRNLRCLSSVPCSFPPLRYLRPGCGPLSCY